MATASVPRKDRPSEKKSPVLPIVLAILLLAGGGWALRTFFMTPAPKTILLMGLDEGKTRTDVLVLARIDPANGMVNAISLPRDTLVDIPCETKSCVTPDKLAHAHAYGGAEGPKYTVKAVETFLGIKIDNYVRMDYDGFEKVIDDLGGVDIVVDKNMDYEDPYAHPPLKIHFKAGPAPQHLTGTKALEFVRFRNDGLGDIGRIERTKKFGMAIFQSMKQSGKITKLPGLVSTMLGHVDTNVDIATAVALARLAPKLEASQIHMSVIPGSDKVLDDGRWVWIADKAKTQELVDAMFKSPKPAESK